LGLESEADVIPLDQARPLAAQITCAVTSELAMDDGNSSDAGSQVSCDEVGELTDFEWTAPPASGIHDFRSEDIDHLLNAPYPRLRKTLGLQCKPETLLNMVKAVYAHPPNRNVRYDGSVFEYYSCGAWRARQASKAGLDVLTNALFRFMDIDHVLEAGMRVLAFDEFQLFRDDMEEKLEARFQDADKDTRALVAKVLAFLEAAST
jgi:hypothetical protein